MAEPRNRPQKRSERNPSLRVRVLLWVSATLVTLFAITVIALDVTFGRGAERALEELLEAHLLGLIALAEPDPDGGLTLPVDALDPHFNLVDSDSGLYGALWNGAGEAIWRSPSWLEQAPDLGALPGPGERRYLELTVPGLSSIQGLLLGVTWEFSDGQEATYVLGTAVSLEPYYARRAEFRGNLVGWFAGMTVTMLVVIGLLLHWVLRPLGVLEHQVREVEAGGRGSLAGVYPSELTGLARALNRLIDTERRRQVRYRDTLDDLAHSLKTPLAVMRSLLSDGGIDANRDAELSAEIDRMEQRVSNQLRRARVSGASGLGMKPTPVAPIVTDLKNSLEKVYRDKGVRCKVQVGPGAVFYGDAGDFTEIMGNLLDNAYKYCKGQVRLNATMESGRLVLSVADDGPGIDPSRIEELTRRGTRADETVPGHGIGLAVVRETVELYQGDLSLGSSPLGGAEVRVKLGRADGGV